MAGERKGKTYEAILKIALDKLKSKGSIKGEIFWNKKPKGMTIEPDFTIGKDQDHPKYVFLVTHSGSAKNSDMKFWRNIGELAEAKLLLTAAPHVYNITFDSVIKEDLKKIQSAAFDGQLIVGDLSYGNKLQEWVDKNHKNLPNKADEKTKRISSLAITDATLKAVLSKLTTDLGKVLKETKPQLDHLWAMDRKRQPGIISEPKETFVRRGLSKLLIFEDIDLALRLYRLQKVTISELPKYAYELGLAKKSIGRAAPADQEILSAVNLLSDSQIRTIASYQRTVMHESLLTSLRSLSFIEKAREYVVKNYSALCDPSKMLTCLQKVNANPSKELGGGEKVSVNWLFQIIFDLQRATETMKQEVGYAQMIQAALIQKDEINEWLLTLGLKCFEPRGNAALVRGMTDWVNRLPTKHAEGFSTTYQAVVAWLLAKGLSSMSASELPKIEVLKQFTINNLLEQKLVTYRDFDPVGYLIKSAVPMLSIERQKTCFGQAAGITGLGGNMEIGIMNGTMLNWQSASDAGRDHKKKELCGRAIGLRYSWDQKTKKFIPRPGVKKLILVLDGTWRKEDLNALARSGWDEIYYPDEVEKIAKAII